jgi:GNAT superfamily N-acetyltransferase
VRFAERARRGIARCTAGDLDDLRAFQRTVYDRADEIPTSSLEWLHEQNPHRSESALGVWICRRDGAIVGQQAEVAMTLRVGDERVRAAAAIELVVDEAWRLKGIGDALSRFQEEHAGVAVSLGMSDEAARMYTRRGWRDLGSLTQQVFVVQRSAARHLVRGSRSRVFATLGQPLFAIAGIAARFRTRGTRLVATESFDDRADRVWEAASPAYGVLAHRDAVSLRWRFDASPDAARYRRFYLLRRGEPVGYVVVRDAEWRGAPALKVVDYLAAPRWVPALLAHCVALARAEADAVVDLATRNEPARSGINRLGFVQVPHMIRFMVAIAAGVLAPDALGDPAAWFVTLADADLEFLDLDGDLADA